MGRRLPRLLVLVLLFLAGGYALVYGLFYHKLPFDETKQRTVMEAIGTSDDPSDPPDDGGDGQAAPPENAPPENAPPAANSPPSDNVDPFRSPPGNGPAAGSGNPFEPPTSHGVPNIPGVRLKKVTEDYVDVTFDSEWTIVRDVTVGGVTRLPNGHLKRTYSGKPPALCPT
jgi:hypothetical protein